MLIKIQQFLFGKNHSWSVVGQEIGRALLNRKHEVHFISTDGVQEKYVPKDLAPHIRPIPLKNYDAQISYTAMINFHRYLSSGNKNRFGIWNYEFDILPEGHAKHYRFADKFLPSSKFFYNICAQNKIPEDRMNILPHGVDWNKFSSAQPMNLNTDRKIKFLVNIAQPHIRKNIRGTLEAFGRAFYKNDDVCLIVKVVDKKPEKPFEVSFSKEYGLFQHKFPNHAPVIILRDFIPEISSLYKACDVLFMLPNAEAFHMPSLEMLASGGLVISSRYGGQLDFLDDSNSILVDGKLIRAPRKALYWSSRVNNHMFEPDVEEAAEKLVEVAGSLEQLKAEKLANLDKLRNYFSWNNVAKILEEMME